MATKKPRARVTKTATKSDRLKQSSAARTKRPAISTSDVAEPRRIKPPKRTRLRRTDKRFRVVPVRLPSVFAITRQSFRLLLANWKLLGGMVLVYGLLTIILVHGLNGGTNVTSLKHDVNQIFHGNWGHLAAGLTIFGLLLTSSGSTASDVSGAYQTFLIIVVSLAIVWTFRQVLANPQQKIRIRDGFYQGMYPLVPVILVLLVVGLQLIPALIGATIYGIVSQSDIATTGMEQAAWIAGLIVTISISLYLVCSSLFALYIVTLPKMTPLKALRSARGLVRHRRLMVLRKLLFMPLLLLVISALIMVPIILIVTPIAQWVFFGLTMISIAVIHAYLYTLYRELLVE